MYGMKRKDFARALSACGGVDAVLVTSGMSYWYHGVAMAIDMIRHSLPDVPVILGGIYATLWRGHAVVSSGADFVLSGTLSRCGRRLAEILDLPWEASGRYVPWYKAGLHDGVGYGAIRTARGCPYNCSYCASMQLSNGFEPRSFNDVFDEISFLYFENGVRDFAFYDDALLVDFDRRLSPLLDMVIDSGMNINFHVPNAMHASLVHERCAVKMKEAGFRTLRISLETVAEKRQTETGGKVCNRDVENAVKAFVAAGFSSQDVGVYLLAGLPGQETEEIARGIEFVHSLGVRPYIAEFSPVPGTVEWKRLERQGIVSLAMDPVLTNNSIFYRYYHSVTGKGISHHEMEDLKRRCVIQHG
jgi:radical SAM superfamily enzyme YgiQ (UPF0313 family)